MLTVSGCSQGCKNQLLVRRFLRLAIPNLRTGIELASDAPDR
jgi:hypothetical protein